MAMNMRAPKVSIVVGSCGYRSGVVGGFILLFNDCHVASSFLPLCSHGFLSRATRWITASIHGKMCQRLVVHHCVSEFWGECLNDILSLMLT